MSILSQGQKCRGSSACLSCRASNEGKAIKEISVLVTGAGPAGITDYIIIISVVDVNDGNRTGPYIMTYIIKVCSSSIQ